MDNTNEDKSAVHITNREGTVEMSFYPDGSMHVSNLGYNPVSEKVRGSSSNVVLSEVLDERERQNEKWGVQYLPDGTGASITPLDVILAECNSNLKASELESSAKRSTDILADMGCVTWADILLEEVFEALAEDDLEKLRTELVQVAAVAVQWVEAIDQRPQPKEN